MKTGRPPNVIVKGRRRCVSCRTWPKVETGWSRRKNGAFKSPCNRCYAGYVQGRYVHQQRAYHVNRKFGITLEQCEAILVSQGHRCAICRGDKPSGRFNQWSVDHDHSTGQVRGMLCNACNLGLGKFADSPEILEAAAAYLRKHV